MSFNLKEIFTDVETGINLKECKDDLKQEGDCYLDANTQKFCVLDSDKNIVTIDNSVYISKPINAFNPLMKKHLLDYFSEPQNLRDLNILELKQVEDLNSFHFEIVFNQENSRLGIELYFKNDANILYVFDRFGHLLASYTDFGDMTLFTKTEIIIPFLKKIAYTLRPNSVNFILED